jgi:hypothetical protein
MAVGDRIVLPWRRHAEGDSEPGDRGTDRASERGPRRLRGGRAPSLLETWIDLYPPDLVQLLTVFSSKRPDRGTEMICRAYETAAEAHRHQVRKSGEAYIHHRSRWR